jgi:3-hydroxy-9,10-secoandrosta-1,3,5(10)-triene-9,17-dione monooxygenase reductase component
MSAPIGVDSTEAFIVDRDFRVVMGHFCTGVAVVTGCVDGRAHGFSAQSVQSISLNPPLISIAPAKTSTSWPMIRPSGNFCLNFLADDQRALCRRFAQSGVAKFEGLSWTLSARGSPIIAGALAFVDCCIQAEHDAGDHTIVLGRVFDLGILRRDLKPLLFFRGQFGSFAGDPA